jgi:hypothetical protein
MNGPLYKPVGFEGSSVRRARVFLADDNEEILQRVAQVLASEFDVVGTVLDGSGVARRGGPPRTRCSGA